MKVQGNFRKAHKNVNLRIRVKSAELGAGAEMVEMVENEPKFWVVVRCRE